jgi:hypothetical protein
VSFWLEKFPFSSELALERSSIELTIEPLDSSYNTDCWQLAAKKIRL